MPFLAKFGQEPCTIVQGLWPDFGATLKIRKKSNFDRNQLKLSTQHKNMYIYQKNIKMENSHLAIFGKFDNGLCTIVQEHEIIIKIEYSLIEFFDKMPWII